MTCLSFFREREKQQQRDELWGKLEDIVKKSHSSNDLLNDQNLMKISPDLDEQNEVSFRRLTYVSN